MPAVTEDILSFFSTQKVLLLLVFALLEQLRQFLTTHQPLSCHD